MSHILFLGDNSSSSSSSSLSNSIYQNTDSDLKNQVNADTSETELCLSYNSKRNKRKQDHESDQQTQILRKMWKEYQKL